MRYWTAALVLGVLLSAGCDDKDDSRTASGRGRESETAVSHRAQKSMGPAADQLISYANGGGAAGAAPGDSGRAFFDGTASAYADPGVPTFAGGLRSFGPREPVRYTGASYSPRDLELSGPPPLVFGDAAKTGRLRSFLSNWGGDMRVADEMLSQAARKGMNPLLVLATGMQESGLRNGRVSSAGALGAMQLMPATACDMGACNQSAVRTNVALNVHLGTNYMKQMWDTFVGSDMLAVNPLNPVHAPRVAAALAAYNAGPGNVMKAGGQVPRIAETQEYVQKIFGYYSDLARAVAN